MATNTDGPAKFRKRPVVIEAIRWTGENWGAVSKFVAPQPQTADVGIREAGDSIVISTLEGKMSTSLGDWIIKGVKGEFYPCKPDIFDATYEPAEHILTKVLCVGGSKHGQLVEVEFLLPFLHVNCGAVPNEEYELHYAVETYEPAGTRPPQVVPFYQIVQSLPGPMTT